ncbi:MAG: LytTR family DNA-binding domain-containing protein, partial [Lachnospiraceae bacterium]|nr:LytTR family DNA-binding domain-containing protein [Lachnospiraceae bacterium]
DVMMPGINGIDLGKIIRDYDSSVPVIYTTSSRKFAFEAFGVRAMAYLEKPVSRKELFEVLEEAWNRLKMRKRSKITINTKNGMAGVDIGTILFVENVSRTAVYHLRDGTQLEGVSNRTAFEKTVAPLMEDMDFLQPHKSFFVNMNYIFELHADSFLLEGGWKIPISRAKYGEIKKAYLRWMAGAGVK